MKNQKQAVVMAPDLLFEVLQSSDGDALFFSIGTDNVFYLTREVTQTATGWNKLDLSSALSFQHGGAAVAAKTFSVTQNAGTMAVDLALVVTAGGQDHLYLSLGHANTDAAWASGVDWTAVPFDAGHTPATLTIADVFVMNIPVPGGDPVENIFADVVRTPGDPLKLLDRYYIAPGEPPQWNLHKLAADLAAGSISSCLGQRTDDPVPGIYTFGTINGVPELIFTPQYNYFQPKLAPSPARLALPAGASAIASALDGSGTTSLFVAATGGLFLFTPDNQHDKATPVHVVSNGLVAGASALAAATSAGRTAVWGVDPQGNLFYVTCAAGSEANPAAWSNPVPLLPAAEGFAFYLNLGAGNNVVFAHVDGQNLIQLIQDPVTTDWRQRSILLPSTAINDVVEYNSFTTHIKVTDDNGLVVPNTAVAVTATSPVSVYLNDVYHLLSPTVPVNTTTDAIGVLTVVQETQSLAAVCFRVTVAGTPAGSPAVVADINPMSNALGILSNVTGGDSLAAVAFTNAKGQSQKLLSDSVSTDDRNAAGTAIHKFMQINPGLPADGSRLSPQAVPQTAARAVTGAKPAAAAAPKVWGLSFTGGKMRYYEGEAAIRHFGPRVTAVHSALAGGAPAAKGAGADIAVAAGDMFSWLRQAYNEVTGFAVTEAEGLYHFVLTIAKDTFDILLDSISAIAQAAEFIFNKIKLFIDDLLPWLGALFDWADILRTHSVIKNIFNTYLANIVGGLDGVESQVRDVFTQVQGSVDALAKIPSSIPASLASATVGGTTGSASQAPGLDSPQGNWALHHVKSGAAGSSTNAQPWSGVTGDLESVLTPLSDAVDREKDTFQAALDRFKSDLIDKASDLSAIQIAGTVAAIVTDLFLQSVENVLLTAVEVIKQIMEGVLDFLNATIDIPVISWVYRQAAGAELSVLDLACLLAAIPVTVSYKLITNGSPPYPDDATTTALINAPDWASIKRIFNSAKAPAMVAPRAGALTANIDPRMVRSFVLQSGVMSAIGAWMVSIFGPAKQKEPEFTPLSVIYGFCYLLYVAPDIAGQIPDLENQKGFAEANITITGLMVLKTMADVGFGLLEKGTPGNELSRDVWERVSPALDFGGNILWQVPTTLAFADPENQNLAGLLNFVGGTCFDVNGALSPVLTLVDDQPIIWGAVVALATLFNYAYGAMSCAGSVLAYQSS